MSHTLRLLRLMVRDKAREMSWAEDDVLALAAGVLAKGNPIIEEDQLKALQEYEALSGVTVNQSVREALSQYIECDISVMVEELAERSAQG